MDSNPSKRRKLGHDAGGSTSATRRVAHLQSAAIAGSHRSSIFLLETAELLEEVKVDYDSNSSKAVKELLEKLKAAIEGIEPHGPLPIGEATASFEKKNRITIPYPNPKPSDDMSYKLSLEQPLNCNVVGSYICRTMVKSQKEQSVDMVVEMPRTLFQEKDYLNYRYFYKRSYYLANIAVAAKAVSGVELSFESFQDNSLLPVLVVTPSHTASGDQITGRDGKPDSIRHQSHPRYRVRVIPCCPESLFPARKLLPSSNCIRRESKNDNEGTPSTSSTPFYNSTLKAESTFSAYLRVLRKAEKTCPAFTDACILGRIWLKQRGFGSGIFKGGFGNCEFGLLLALLLQTGGPKGGGLLLPTQTSTQLFRAAVQFLATTALQKNPCVLGAFDGTPSSVKESIPVIFDAARQLNIAHRMSSSSGRMLRQHARRTRDLLKEGAAEQFRPTFITKADVSLQNWDLLVRVKLSNSATRSTSLDPHGTSWGFCESISRTLVRALGERADLVHVQVPGQSSSWSPHSSPPSVDASTVLVGFAFNPVSMGRQVDRGPPVEDKQEAEKFCQFWGPKAETRKFQDGSIRESLTWEAGSPFAICEEIIRYILRRQLSLGHDDLEFYGRDFASLLPGKASAVAERFNAARNALEMLERDIRSLEDLPLHVRQLAATAPELRSSSIRPPILSSAKAALHPIDVVLSFEASGKWPDNLAAIQRAKIAFLLKIGTSLEKTKSGISTQVGLEDSRRDVENLAFLDIIYDDGAAFRLRIHSDLEGSILERQIKDKTLDQHSRTESARLLGTFKRLYTLLPSQNRTITTLCSRFSALSATIRLTKLWFASHHLASHFTDEFIELAVLHVFIQPYPWDSPSSAMTGFLRTLLFLSHFDWRTDALIVDWSGELSTDDRSAIGTRLEAWRKLDPNMNHTVVFVATPHDTSGTAYTSAVGHPLPNKVSATRMTTLARSACKLVKERGLQLDAKILFQPSLRDYDVLIHLSAEAVKGILRDDDKTRHSRFKNLDDRTGRALRPVLQHAARALLDSLNEAYGSPLLFFHGAPEDTTVVAVWDPQVRMRSFRVNLPCSFKPVARQEEQEQEQSEEEEGDDLVEVNRAGILAEIARIGGDLIESIETPVRRG